MLKPLYCFAVLFLAASASAGELPVASGRQIAMSQPQWKLFIPDSYSPRAGGKVDLLVHFHGVPQTVWNNVEQAQLNAVVVTANYNGLSSAYRVPFSDPALFQSLLDDALVKLKTQTDFGTTTNWDQLGVSSFSAGYGAVREIIKSPGYRNAIDGLLAADSLYASTASDGTPVDSQMVDYKAFADLAAAEEKTFIFSHTKVLTHTYENTAETGDELLAHLSLAPTSINETGLGPLTFYRKASKGNFALWGSPGATGDDHLNHLRYMAQWLDDLPLANHSTLDPRAVGDFNADGQVDAADYTVWQDTWLQLGENLAADADNDGFVGNTDYAVWASHFGETVVTASTAVPEPSTVGLLFIAMVFMKTALVK